MVLEPVAEPGEQIFRLLGASFLLQPAFVVRLDQTNALVALRVFAGNIFQKFLAGISELGF